MFIIGQLFLSLSVLFSMLFKAIYFLLVIRIILSWFQISPYSEPANMLYRITDPILTPLKKLPLQFGMIDFSPIVAFLLISFLDSFFVGVLRQLAYKLGGSV